MGTESLGVIGCIFAENGPLEGGIESSFWGTGWGAKGDFMRYSYLYPYIFESRTHTFFESTCPELYAQQSWEWSDAYSWRNDLWKVNFKRFVRSRPESLWWFEVDFWPLSVHFRRGPPTIFRKHMPSGMGTESLGMIGCIFAENGPLEGGIESSFWGTGWGAKGDFRRIFGPDPFIFEGGPPPFSESTCPQVWAQKVGSDWMYIRGEWALRRWHWIKFLGTGWGAKGDFMRYSYLYPYIFESRTHTFFESTCPELYAQQSWEWSDAYSWRNDLWKVNFKRVCEKPAGVLMVIWSGFLAPKRSFSKGPPTIFRKHMPSGMGTESLGMIGCIFAENGPLEGGIESSFWGTGWVLRWFQTDFWPRSVHFRRGPPHHFPKAHALRYGHRKFGSDWMYIRGEWALRRWHWIKFLGYRLGC